MKLLLTLLVLLPTFVFAQKSLHKCINVTGEERFTTRNCESGERHVVIEKYQSLTQFAQKASQSIGSVQRGLDNTDLTHYLQQNFSQHNWPEHVLRSFLESDQAVVVVDTFSLRNLESICKATMKWIELYPHSRFNLQSMRVEFDTGETFRSRYIELGTCDYELR